LAARAVRMPPRLEKKRDYGGEILSPRRNKMKKNEATQNQTSRPVMMISPPSLQRFWTGLVVLMAAAVPTSTAQLADPTNVAVGDRIW
jgi:hypothetical protein